MAKVKPAPYQPDVAIPPGKTILQVLQDKGMSQTELADRMNRPNNKVNEMLRGKKEVTAETALQLEQVLGLPASFWMELERNYQLNRARLAQQESLLAETRFLKMIPIRELVKLGVMKRFKNAIAQAKEALNFFAVTSFAQLQKPSVMEPAFRKPLKKEANHYSLAAWLRCGEVEAEKIDTGEFNAAGLRSAIPELRRLSLLSPEEFVPELVRRCAINGVAVVFIPHLSKSYVSGAAYWIGDKAVIQLTLRFRTNDHFWFSFFHELGHILLHGKKDTFLDDFKPDHDEKEQAANAFASKTLIPDGEFKRLCRLNYRQTEVVKDFALGIGIAPGIVVGRLQHEKLLPHSHLNALKVKFAWVDETGPEEEEQGD